MEKPSTAMFVTFFILCLAHGVLSDGTVTVKDFKTHLAQYGYLAKGPQNRTSFATNDYIKAIKNFQQYGGIPVTGTLDNKTKQLLDTERCGVSDAPSRYNTDSNRKWWSNSLTYKVTVYTPDLNNAQVDATVALALKFWSDVADLTFTKSSSNVADIIILFGSYAHAQGTPRCYYPFDGPRGVLAHAYYPSISDRGTNSINGDAHFDESEAWTINVATGINLQWVAVHEFGHSLGLGHTNVRDAIMYPYYTGYDPDMNLHQDDIDGIVNLYGTKDPENPDDPPCVNGFKALAETNSPLGKRITVSSFQQCKQQCSKNKCWAYSWFTDGKCEIFNFVFKTVASGSFYKKVSAEDGTISYNQRSGRVHKGGLIIGTVVVSDCKYMCTSYDRCIGYSFSTKGVKDICQLHYFPLYEAATTTHYVKC